MKTAGSSARLQAVVHGRVQGVAFRHYTARRSRELGLVGYARNRGDGSVEVVAEGSRAALEELLAFLNVGPQSAYVLRVDVQWFASTGTFEQFEVRY